MKNAEGKKAYAKNVNSEKPKIKPLKRVRSKHRKSKQQRLNNKNIFMLTLLNLMFVGLVVFSAMKFLKITVTQIGLPIENGVYLVTYNGEDIFDQASDSIFGNKYHISFDDGGKYTIRNIHTNLVLSAVIDYNASELGFEFLPANNACEQNFFMSLGENGSRLISACDAKMESFEWQFEAAKESMNLPFPSRQELKDGIYALVPNSNLQGVLNARNDGVLQVSEKDNSPSQLFEIRYNDIGYYSIYSLELQAYADISNEGVLLFDSEEKQYCGQNWAIITDGDANKIVSSCNGSVWSALDGVNVGVNDVNNDASVLWNIENRRTILFVGDSITEGRTNCNYSSSYCQSALSNAVDVEMSILNSETVKYVDINVGNPGATTSSYSYGMNDKYFDQIRQYRIEIAQVMLGTNDSAMGVSSGAYEKNLLSIINKLLEAGVKKIIVNWPIYNAVGPSHLVKYAEAINGLANDDTVFVGDTQGYDWFEQNLWHLDGNGAGFHPDQEGYRMLGELWATAFQLVVEN
jgi:Lysophospholipase L1 and related esterases